ncbi:glycine betaine/proline transport system substrate-binding protein [Desulfonispora thiosulfatigenes DSM 11270]|uniref:Glycine betaine/proline transport system substrate-binding protein n=1 Tax=Desulfonispora thiosulfatigenes DSM 11270 TaxID=656914 RepID=A0A1W1V2S9_DESTI|nr:glycine betaine ABC transporter substrate-binding protein [Desulfonispora thiosulfatigenes]SMB87659.1 glycine betaine/proline transport system substrate-binding protein [Desulfonispora thiosulfatigenes DSM 11270]
MKKYLVLSLILLLSLSLVVGCNSSASKDDEKKIELLYAEWDSTIASTNVLKAVLQEKMGYDVEMTSVSIAAIWQGIASGDGDAMAVAWLPTNHDNFYQEYKDKVEDLGVNLEGTKQGLAVPEYVDINSIDELNANFDKLDGKIIGIEPGSGLMTKTKQVMKENDLENFELMQGSGATMVAALADAINNKKPIVVTAWSPHWMFGRWDLKYLDDPKETFGGEEQIHTIVRKGLQKDHPEAYKFLDKFNWTPEDMQEVMNMNQKEDADPYESAKIWISENEDKVNAWLE